MSYNKISYSSIEPLKKSERIAGMFDNISRTYDLLNRLLSMGIDVYWRRCAIRSLAETSPDRIIDVATGTGDLAIASVKLNPKQIVAIDISEGMLSIGEEKIKKKGLQNMITFMKANVEQLHFQNDSFDVAMSSFGVRNFENTEKGLREMCRVIRPGGRVVILEFARPKNLVFRSLYYAYFRYILPIIGRLISSDRDAYRYLPTSVQRFPEGKDFIDMMKRIGYKDVRCRPLTLGISALYTASK